MEWGILDEVIAQGFWPDKRAFLLASNEAGYQAAVKAMIAAYEASINGGPAATAVIEVFAPGAYTDRDQLKRNNIIIDRISTPPGEVGFAYPFQWERQPDFTFKEYRTADGTRHIEYEVRIFCNDVRVDRAIVQMMHKVFGQRRSMKGVNEDLTKTDDTFDIVEKHQPVDLSGKNFTERLFQYQVKDVELDERTEIGTAKQMLQSNLTQNVARDQEEAAYPLDTNDVVTSSYGPIDLLMQFVETTEAYRNMDIVRVYAQDTQAHALIGKPRRLPNATNGGVVFVPFKGFSKALVTDFLSTKFDRAKAIYFAFVHCSWTFMLMDDPGVCDLAGFVDGVSDFRVRHAADGLYVKMNSLQEFKMSETVLKKNVVYVLNKPISYMLELWSGGELIKRILIDDPQPVTAGEVYELSVNGAVSVAATGSIGFSAYGGGLRGSSIAEWSKAVKKYFAKLDYE